MNEKMNSLNGSKGPVIEIFWTGGFDSSFRIVQLSRCEVQIQPYYLSDNRQSESKELQAIQDITELLKQHGDTKCVFLDLVIVDIGNRMHNADISKAWTELRKTDFFGDQYDWLACFALEHKGIELSIHEDDKAIELISKYGQLKQISDPGIGDYWVLDSEKSSPQLKTLFENYHFPLAKWTKLEMKAFFEANGYSEIMKKTWFCYHPIHGKPCGYCNPCMYTIEEGMPERFTKTALLRYQCKKMAQKSGILTLVQTLRRKKRRQNQTKI